MQRALFGRKVKDLKELKEITKQAKSDGVKGSEYTVVKEIKMNDSEFKVFATNFLKDQDWISKEDGGVDSEKGLICIRVTNIETGEKVLVDSEGYTYPRYVALE